MQKEISSGAMLGVVLIALAAIIGLGFGVFAIAKGTANEGVVGVQENLGAVADSAFDDYDQKIVTGTQVLSAYSNFEGKSVAFLVSTRAFISQVPPLDEKVEYPGEDSELTVPLKDEDGAIKALNNGGEQVDLVYINYNALLSAEEELRYDNGVLVTSKGFNNVNGSVKFNSVIGGLTQSGCAEYIPSTSRFQANLIKDSSGTIMGVAFQQI